MHGKEKIICIGAYTGGQGEVAVVIEYFPDCKSAGVGAARCSASRYT